MSAEDVARTVRRTVICTREEISTGDPRVAK